MMDFFDSSFIAGEIVEPMLIGSATGYFSKKAIKGLMLLLGAIVLMLFLAEQFHIVNINDKELVHRAGIIIDQTKTFSELVRSRLSEIAVNGVSALIGFYTGFKLG